MQLSQHDRDFSIRINGLELMNSRQHASEQELARLGCAHLAGRPAPCVLIGGLGMGYTLRQALDQLPAGARVVVSELLPDVVEWNRTFLGELNGQPLDDPRVEVITGDVLQLVYESKDKFDALLLDVDNGPNAMTDTGNDRLYSAAGMQACRHALRSAGALSIWSTEQNKGFERLLASCGFNLRRYRVKAYQASSAKALFIWVAAEDAAILPPGGSDPFAQPKP
jgi:spermidine synthase